MSLNPASHRVSVWMGVRNSTQNAYAGIASAVTR
jgi:hypothetical protein